jgi:hypothetical protein
MRTLYTDPTENRYFLIPAGAELPEGDFTLRSLAGAEERAVAEAALAEFELGSDEAEQYLKDELAQGMAQSKSALAASWEIARKKAKARREAWEKRPPSPQVKKLLGFNAEELRENPKLAEEALHRFFGGLKTVLAGAAGDDPSTREAARQEMRDLQSHLEAAGADPGESLADFPDKLHDAYHAAERAATLRSTAAGLETLADEVSAVAGEAEQKLREDATGMQQKADEIE